MESQGVLRMLFTGLVRLDDSLNPRLELAESYRISSDNKTYVFTLKNSQWSDGSPITAYDFEQTWKAALTPAYSSSCTNLFFYIKNAQKAFLGQTPLDQVGVKALDDKTLIVELELPNSNFLNVLINSIFSPVHSSMRYTAPNQNNLICSGPFCLKKYIFQDQIALVKNPLYWNSKTVKLDELRYYIVKNLTTALLMFEKKEIDWLGEPLTRISLDSIPALRAKGLLQYRRMAGQQWIYLNTDKYPLNNANIRKALAYAIDRKMIMQEVLHLDGMTPTLGLIPQILKKERWHPWFKDNDVQEAKILFQKGLKELGIAEEAFPKMTICFAGPFYRKIVETTQQMWKKNLGIEVILEELDGAVVYSKRSEHDFQITMLGWVLQFNDPINMLEIFKYKNSPPNCSGWENPEFIRHAIAALSAATDQDRWEQTEAAEKIFCDEMPSIPMSDCTATCLVQPYVKGVTTNYLYLIDFDRASIEKPTP